MVNIANNSLNHFDNVFSCRLKQWSFVDGGGLTRKGNCLEILFRQIAQKFLNNGRGGLSFWIYADPISGCPGVCKLYGVQVVVFQVKSQVSLADDAKRVLKRLVVYCVILIY